MFGLSEAHYNIVKKSARECSKEIGDRIKQKDEKYDRIASGVIAKHYQPVSTLLTRTQFVWLCGYLNGRFGATGEYE